MNTTVNSRKKAEICEYAKKKSAAEAARDFAVKVQDVEQWLSEESRERMQGIESRPGKREETVEKVKEVGRRRRHSNGGFNQNLYIPQELIEKFDKEGYKVRWMNDQKNNLNRQYNNDWDFINNDEISGYSVGQGVNDNNTSVDSRVSVIVGSTDSGSPIRSFLMKKKKEYYIEDQQDKLKSVREVEAAIKSGRFTPSGSEDNSNTYVPREGIKLSERINNNG